MKITEEIENICLADAYINGDVLYAAGFEWNSLIEFNIQTHVLRRLGEFDGFKFQNSCQNNVIFEYEKSLFFISANSYEIAEFDLKQNHFRYYHPNDNITEYGLIHSVCRIKDEIWIFRKAVDKYIMNFSMKRREYTYYQIDIEGKIDNYTPLSIESSIYVDSQIWRCIPGSSDLLIFDLKKLKMQVIKTNLQMQFERMNYNDGFLYILTLDGKYLVSLNLSTYEIITYRTGYTGISKFAFFNVEKIGNYFFFIPCFENEIFYYKMEKNVLHLVQHIKFPKEFKKIHDIEHRTLFKGWKMKENRLYLFPFGGNGMLCMDLNSLDITYYPIKVSEEEYLGSILQINSVQNEKEWRLKDYLTGVVHSLKARNEKNSSKTKEHGSTIWSQFNP